MKHGGIEGMTNWSNYEIKEWNTLRSVLMRDLRIEEWQNEGMTVYSNKGMKDGGIEGMTFTE